MSQLNKKGIYSVWINQCWECNEISNIVTKNAGNVETMNDIEEKIKKKYIISDDGWNEEYKDIIKPKKVKGELVTEGHIIINLRKYKIYADVERHKCCRCGGNY